MSLIDVIIPMYNSERYIPGLIRSLEGQSMKDFCAIFVDDGSTDGTYELLNRQLSDVSFAYQVIRQENKGLPGARNTGIRHAHSEYLTFLDSDDGLDSQYFEYLLRGVREYDAPVGICGYQMIAREEDAVPSGEYAAQDKDAETVMREYYISWFGAWVLILRRSWLEEKGLLFDERCTYLEDVPFITQVIASAQHIAVIQNSLYLYYQRPGSLMNTPKIEKYQIALDGFHRMANKLQQMDCEPAKVFASMGKARYYLATLRKGAVLMPYSQFQVLCKYVPMESVKEQFCCLTGSHRLACGLYLVSKRLFHTAMRMLTNV